MLVVNFVQDPFTTRCVTKSAEKQHYIIVLNTDENIISKRDFETVQQLIRRRKWIGPQEEKHL
jgi:hypothetical protein